jgi:hypothetical protein
MSSTTPAETLQMMETMMGASVLLANPITSVTAATSTKPMVTSSNTGSPSEVAGQGKNRVGA